MRFAFALIALLAAGCATPRGSAPANWRTLASEDDHARLRDWRSDLDAALKAARAAGQGARIDAEGPLLQLDAALVGAIPAGRYRCRWIKLGGRNAYQQFGPYPCSVRPSGGGLAFAVDGGAQRPAGTFYPADRIRLAFLGGLALGDEAAAMAYGTDPDRDMAGWVERIGDARWRILLPRPRFDSAYDVIEVRPAA